MVDAWLHGADGAAYRNWPLVPNKKSRKNKKSIRQKIKYNIKRYIVAFDDPVISKELGAELIL